MASRALADFHQGTQVSLAGNWHSIQLILYTVL